MPKAPSQHRRPGQRTYREREHDRKRTFDADRGNSAQRGYGSEWRKYRKTFLASNPLCVECAREGRLVSATIVDHIKDHRGDPALFWDRANHQALCKAHHDAKTARTCMNAGSNAKL